MKHSSWIRIIAMIMLLCMLFTACAPKEAPSDDNSVETPDNTPDDAPDQTPDDTPNDPPVDPVCKHETSIIKNAKPTGCTVPGYTGDKVCASCGEILEKGTAIPTVDHVYDEGMVTKNPTCMEEGKFTYTCTGCGTTKSDVLPTVPHDDQYHDAFDGTHNHTCTTCTMTENEKHTPTDGGIYHAAGCLESAYTEYTCAVCQGVYKVYDETSPAVGHSWGEWTLKEATCVADGHKIHTCFACGDSETIVLPATPDIHNHEFAGYEGDAPSCSNGAVAIYVCVDCKEDSYTKDVPATGLHNYEVVQDNGDGWIISKCDGCGKEVSQFDASHLVEAEVKTESIPDDKPFEVTTQNATIEFPTDVIGQIKGDSGESLDVSISAGVLDEAAKNEAIEKAKENLSDEAKARLEDVDIYDFNVTVSGAALSDDFASAVTVTIAYTLKTLVDDEGNEYLEDSEGIIIWYVGTDGVITEIRDVQYNADNETVTFLAPHFSMYAVAYEETQEMRCRRGNHAYEALFTVETSCLTHGYTLYECSCCHRKTVDDIVEKKKHTYGDIIDPVPTCENGDYYHRVCADCGDVLNLQYVRALGHTLDQVASCESGSSCSRCNKTVTPALGHNWSEWKVIIPAGELTKGLKVRYCLRCGKADSSNTASSGDITALEFETYEQLVKQIYDLVIGLDNGIIEFSCLIRGVEVDATATINTNGDDLLVSVEFTAINEGDEIKGLVIYRNGVVLVESSEMDVIGASDIDSLEFIPLNVALKYMEAFYNYVNPYAEMCLGMAREELAKYILVAGADINEALAAAGCEYTVEDLYSILDSVETVYAYVSLKLGYTTAAEIKDGVEIPTKNDILNLMKAFMEETPDGENTKYSVNAEPLLAAVNTVLDWAETNLEKSVADIIFELLGEEIAKIDISITDADTLATYLKTNLPGTLKVKDVIDKLVTLLEESEVITLTELYGIINTLVVEATPYEEFDIEAMISEYYEITLNDLVTSYFGEGATAEQLYEMLAQQAKELKLGSINVKGMLLSDLVARLSSQLGMFDVKAEFSFTVDGYGKIVSITLDEFFNALMPGEEEGSYEKYPIQNLTLNVIRDDTVKVVIPDKFNPVDFEVEDYYDSEGNFVISGIPSDFEIDVYLGGSYEVALGEILHKDAEMSDKLGYDVYVAHPDFWDHQTTVETLILIDGKYYTYEHEYSTGYDGFINSSVDVFEFIENPYIVLPDGDDQPIGYYDGKAIYATAIGAMVERDGAWWVCNVGINKDNGDGTYDIDYAYESYNFSERFGEGKTVELSSIEENYYSGWGMSYNARINIYVGAETYSFYGNSYDETVLLENNIPVGDYGGSSVVVLGEEVSLNDYTYDEMNIYGEKIYINVDGEAQLLEAERVYLSKKLPTYYMQIADGVYLDVESYALRNYTVPDGETMELPDGNILYLSGVASAVECGYAYGDVYYGYVKVAENLCVRAYCVEQDGYIVDICYEGARKGLNVSYSDMFNVSDYMTVKADGSIVISKALISLLEATCTEDGDYVGILVNATKSVNGHGYMITKRVAIKWVADNVVFDGFGGASSDDRDIFDKLFGGMGSGGEGNTTIIYVNEDGDLVVQSGNIYHININFNDKFPADSILNYNSELSKEYGYNIYTYDMIDQFNDSKLLIDGKYYDYSWNHNYRIETDTIENIVANRWHIRDMRYRYNLVPNDIFPDSIPVYDTIISFANSNYSLGYRYDAEITVYMIVYNGEACVLTGAYPTGESLITFEGYMPADEYFESLEISTSNNYESWAYINGEQKTIVYTKVTLAEADYDITKTMTVIKASNGEYVYKSSYLDDYLHIGSEFTVPDNYIFDSTYISRWWQGSYVTASFRYEEKHVYEAIKIGDRFYDYGDFRYGYHYPYEVIEGEEEFKKVMYGTDRIYLVWDEEYGDYRYYEKFIPGDYITPFEEVFDVTIPNDHNKTTLGYDKNGNQVYEIWYYIDSSLDSDVEEKTLSDGSVFYHINGIGYVKIVGTSTYVKAFDVELNDGTTEVVCTIYRAYVEDYHLSNYNFFKDYISYTEYSVVIPRELLDIMKTMPDYCYFSLNTHNGDIRFDYYTLESYFMNGGNFGGNDGNNGDYGDYDDFGNGSVELPKVEVEEIPG